MADTGTEQRAFRWPAASAGGAGKDATEARAERPAAPPTAGGGAARGAPREKPVQAEPHHAPVAQLDRLPPDDELWDVRAAARFLKRSVSWVYHKAEDGTLPVRRLGGWGVRFIPAELRAWVERQQMKADSTR